KAAEAAGKDEAGIGVGAVGAEIDGVGQLTRGPGGSAHQQVDEVVDQIARTPVDRVVERGFVDGDFRCARRGRRVVIDAHGKGAVGSVVVASGDAVAKGQVEVVFAVTIGMADGGKLGGRIDPRLRVERDLEDGNVRTVLGLQNGD